MAGREHEEENLDDDALQQDYITPWGQGNHQEYAEELEEEGHKEIIKRSSSMDHLLPWLLPECGWMKLNADGFLQRDKASFGGLVRDFKGFPLLLYHQNSALDSHDIAMVDLLGALTGLENILKFFGKRVKIWLELDSKICDRDGGLQLHLCGEPVR